MAPFQNLRLYNLTEFEFYGKMHTMSFILQLKGAFSNE